jgi:hypothetical protein
VLNKLVAGGAEKKILVFQEPQVDLWLPVLEIHFYTPCPHQNGTLLKLEPLIFFQLIVGDSLKIFWPLHLILVKLMFSILISKY